MATIKSVNRSAMVALSPDGPYMAAGTMAGAVDLSFSSSASLEIFKFDFQSDDQDLPLVGETSSNERFNRLTWSRAGSGSDHYSLGLIAGGLVDGCIDIWNPLALIGSESNEGALVSHLAGHKGPVRGLEFNTISPNLLASGADDGEIYIWDLAKPTEPSHFPPLKSGGSAAHSELSYISWNSKVQNILASASPNGTTVVWDLKKQKPIITVGDSVRRHCSVLQWHPDVATQLVVASDDDNFPSLRLWDMRNTMTPVKEFVGHTKGVIAMSWCPSESSYLLTCAKDNRTICWNTASGEIVCELPAGANWNFDVHWYPKIPGVITASSFDGKIGVYNIEGCSRCITGENDFGATTLRAPKWYKRPGGASFGFGGKLVVFQPKSSGTGALPEVFLHNIVTEESLASRSSEFEAAIQHGKKESLKALCDKKSQQSESEDEREIWAFLKILFEEDGTARSKMLAYLGFSLPAEEKDYIQDELSQEVSAVSLDDTVTQKVGYEGEKVSTILSGDDGEDFFNNLSTPKAADAHVPTSADNLVSDKAIASVEEVREEADAQEESNDPAFDDCIQRALVVGDYKGAVAQCVAAGKMTDALVIAHTGGISLWESTRDQYLQISNSPYLKIVSAMASNNYMKIVNTRPLKYWKDTLAFLCTFAPAEEWSTLCNLLASKLVDADNALAATLCYICAGNIDKTVEIWSRSLSTENEGKSYVDLLQDLMEKTIVLALASGEKQFSASLCKLVEKYAEILASQGLLSTAMEYLKLLESHELSPELIILRDRIALSIVYEKEPETTDHGNSQQLSGSIYVDGQSNSGAINASQYYYQEAAPAQMNPSIPETSFREPYGQVHGSSYGRGYSSMTPYQPAMQAATFQPAPPPQMFVPSQAPLAAQETFGQPHTTAQQPVKTFVPSNFPTLRNAEQYQQPTLASQLYPGTVNPTHNPVQPPTGPQGPIASQTGSSPGHRMPQVVASTPTPMGFRPATSPGGMQMQRPGINSMQPPSPSQLASIQPAVAPAAPPPTVQTVDTSNVPAHHRPVIATLRRLFEETSDALGGPRANPSRKREIEDNSRKIGALFAKLNSGDISRNASDNLVQLCQALDQNDFATAVQIQVHLTTTEWDECNFWLATLKRMIKTRQGVGARSS